MHLKLGHVHSQGSDSSSSALSATPGHDCYINDQLWVSMQLFEYILEYLRTVRFGEPENSLALPTDQTELAQVVREVCRCLSCPYHVTALHVD